MKIFEKMDAKQRLFLYPKKRMRKDEKMPEVSLIVSARDNFSNVIRNLSRETNAFDRNLEELQGQLDTLNRNRTVLRVDMEEARREVQQAQRAFRELGDETSRLSLESAIQQADAVRDNYREVERAIRDTQRAMRDLNSDDSRRNNRAGNGGGAGGDNGGGSGGASSLAAALGQAGAYEVLGEVAAQAAQAYVGSAFGSEASTMFSSALSYAGQGAAIGSMIAPGVGTAVGAAAGAGLGLLSGGISLQENKDDRFREYVQSTYEGIQAERQTQLMTGSSIAAGRETALNSFETLFGDRGIAETFIANMVKFANKTPFLFDDLASMAKVLATYGYQVEELQGVMQDIGDAGAALGMGQEDMNMVATALGRMKSSGKTSLEYVNILQERGIDAIGYLAEARGTDNAQVYADISKSLIDGAEAAKIIQDAMRADFAGSMQKQSETFSGLSSTVQGLQDEMANAMGAGYNETRKQGMQEQISFLSGAAAEQMQEAYKYIGQFQADLENKKEEYLRDAMTAVMEGAMGENFSAEMKTQLEGLHEEYQKSIKAAEGGDKEAQAELGAILAEAQAAAMAAYTTDEGEKLRIEAELEAIQGIQKNAAITEAYDDAGYELGKRFSYGLSRARSEINWELAAKQNPDEYGGIFSRAMGESRVPRDGIYMLHEGEKVLTASQARAYDSSGGIEPFSDLGGMMEMGMPFEMERTTTTTVTDWPAPTPGTAQGAGGSAGTGGVNVTITGNEFVVRSESDIDAIAQALARNLAQAQMVT